jgi:toxin ParE1/3/4
VKLRYTPRAAAELDEILSFIDERSPHGARSVKNRIQAVTALLLRYPQAGHPTSKSGIRRMIVYPYPYDLLSRHRNRDRHSRRTPQRPPPVVIKAREMKA